MVRVAGTTLLAFSSFHAALHESLFESLFSHAFQTTTLLSKQGPTSLAPPSLVWMSTETDNSSTETAKPEKKERYVPKWKKKATLAETIGDDAGGDAAQKGLIGGVPISFQSGKGEEASFINTTALPGQPLKLVASQAGQYIKYGCGKGECGTCESLCNGKYLRPCVDVVPTDLIADPVTSEYPQLVIQVKSTKAKVVSSGKFFSAKSFVLGFWNNFLGMAGFVRDRRKARKNWQERMDFEDEVARLTAEKKRKRLEAANAAGMEGAS